MEDPRRGSSVPPEAAEIFALSSPVTPPQARAALWYKRRWGTRICANVGLLPTFREAAFSVRYRPGKAQATKGCQAVSLAFSHALRAHKGKVVGLCPTTRKLFEKSLIKNFKLASLGHYSSHNTFSVSTSSCFSIPHSCAAFTASCRCSSTLRSCSSFKNSVFFPATKLPFPVRE